MISVYTCISGNYDRLKRQPKFKGVSYTCFTDNPKLLAAGIWQGWKIKPTIVRPQYSTPHLINRYHKIHCCDVLPDAEASIYIDGSVILKRDPSPIVDAVLQGPELIGAFHHPARHSVLDEFDACDSLGKIPAEYACSARDYKNTMIAQKFDRQLGLSVNSLLVRGPSSPALRALMSAWWKDVSERCHRDQLALQYTLWRRGQRWKALDDVIARKRFIRQMGHRRPGLYGHLLEIGRMILR